MNLVLAAIDDSAAAEPVTRMATLMAELIGARPGCLHVIEGDDTTVRAMAERAQLPLELREGDATAEIVAATEAPGVELLVIGCRCHPAGRRPAGHVTQEVLESVSKPVMVVPPDARVPTAGEGPLRVLLPLEGTESPAGTVAGVLDMLADAGAELVAVHVFDEEAGMPRFWDHAAHAEQSWASEFLGRLCTESDVDLHLRTGAASQEIRRIIDEKRVDAVVLAWSQTLTGGRAEVVRSVLGSASVPVLLVPKANRAEELRGVA